MGKNKDVQPRTRKAAGPAEQAARSSMIARKAAGERKKAVEAAAAARAAMQASLLGSGRQRASGAGSSSQDAGGVPAASQSAEAAAAGDRAVPAAAEPQAAAADDVLEQGEAMLYHDKQSGDVVEVTVLNVHRDDVQPYYSINLPSGQTRETLRKLLWHKGEEPPTDRAGAPTDANEQACAYVACAPRHALAPHTKQSLA